MKKFIAIFLTLSMLLCSFGTTNVFAKIMKQERSSSHGDILWTYNTKTKVFTIGGEGDLDDENTPESYYDDDDNDIIKDVKEIIIQDGIEGIRDGAFIFFDNAVKLTIPSSVTFIEEGAFRWMKSLEHVIINTTTAKIEKEAFYGCESLENIEISNRYLQELDDIFYNCGLFGLFKVNENGTRMYSSDGRSEMVNSLDVEDYKKNGWSTNESEFYTTMYAVNGSTRQAHTSEVESYKKVGWYTEPVQTLYKCDNVSKVFKKTDVKSQLALGWYETPVVRMYALDGRTLVIPKDKIAEYENVGWYYGKPIEIFDGNGNSILFGENHGLGMKKGIEYYNNGLYYEAIDEIQWFCDANWYNMTEQLQQCALYYLGKSKSNLADYILQVGKDYYHQGLYYETVAEIQGFCDLYWSSMSSEQQQTALDYLGNAKAKITEMENKQYYSVTNIYEKYSNSNIPTFESVVGKRRSGSELFNGAWTYKYSYYSDQEKMYDDFSWYVAILENAGYSITFSDMSSVDLLGLAICKVQRRNEKFTIGLWIDNNTNYRMDITIHTR